MVHTRNLNVGLSGAGNPIWGEVGLEDCLRLSFSARCYDMTPVLSANGSGLLSCSNGLTLENRTRDRIFRSRTLFYPKCCCRDGPNPTCHMEDLRFVQPAVHISQTHVLPLKTRIDVQVATKVA